jgi:hypothetical protein
MKAIQLLMLPNTANRRCRSPVYQQILMDSHNSALGVSIIDMQDLKQINTLSQSLVITFVPENWISILYIYPDRSLRMEDELRSAQDSIGILWFTSTGLDDIVTTCLGCLFANSTNYT